MPSITVPDFTWHGPTGATNQFEQNADLADVAVIVHPGLPAEVAAHQQLIEEAGHHAVVYGGGAAAIPDDIGIEFGPVGAEPPAAEPPAAAPPAPAPPAPPAAEPAAEGVVVVDEDPEVVIGASNLRPISFLEKGTRLAKAVARITVPGVGSGTGFLIADDLLLTNNHVIPSEAVASEVLIEFDYQDDLLGKALTVKQVAVKPNGRFFTSPYKKQVVDKDHLDFTVVQLAKKVGATHGTIRLDPTVEVEPRFDVFIIQHPNGEKKQIAIAENELVWADSFKCQYLTDTLAGSSGSPVFNDQWRLVALHHAGAFSRQPGDPQAHVQNEGIRIDAIVAALPDWAK